MSASNEWFEYHLTPQGWVTGSEKIDFSGIKGKDIPTDRVLTLRFNEYMSSSFSTMDKWCDEQYRHEDESLVNRLVKQFGESPGRYKKSEYPIR
jgi:hypothetical protein